MHMRNTHLLAPILHTFLLARLIQISGIGLIIQQTLLPPTTEMNRIGCVGFVKMRYAEDLLGRPIIFKLGRS